MKITREIVIKEIQQAIEETNKQIEKHGFKVSFDESSLNIDSVNSDEKCFFCNMYGEKKEEIVLDTVHLSDLRKYNKLSELKKFEEDAHCLPEFIHILQNYKKKQTNYDPIENYNIKVIISAAAVGIGLCIWLFKKIIS